MTLFRLNEMNYFYGIKPRPRHGQRSTRNHVVLPFLPIDMQFEIPIFGEYAQELYLSIEIIWTKILLRQSPERNEPLPMASSGLEPSCPTP
ncbi:hypothetical protein TNCV_3087011 [Trichonephila clavipes]|nr:hypothetical protein TNCV_3087011 [Trichonephila clavipes]